MIVLDRVDDLRAALAPVRGAGGRVGLVPTMGALHDGHLALIGAAAAECDVVVVSIFVNPAQFTDPADLDAYPRTWEIDAEAAQSAGADIVFAPTDGEVYPDGFATSIRVRGVSERWEGEGRGAAHFDGVAVVVAKLLLMTAPDAAWFGAKDAQQVAVVRRLVTDLDIPVTIEALPTVRDADGLALSSRNARLTPLDRSAALSLNASLQEVDRRVDDGEVDATALARLGRGIVESAGGRVEYWAIVDPATFEPVDSVGRGALAIVAATVAGVRLIDNVVVGEGQPRQK